MVCNNYLEHLCGSIQYKHTRTVYDPGYAWPRFALIRFQLKDRFVAIRFKQTTDSYLIRFLILAASRFLGAPVDSIRFDSKRFCFFRFRTGSIPYVQRFRLLNRFGTILLHSTTLHYTTLQCTTLHYTTLRYLPLHFITLHYTTLHYTTNTTTTIQLHSTTLHYTKLHYTTLHYTTLHYTTLHNTTTTTTQLHSATLHYTPLH